MTVRDFDAGDAGAAEALLSAAFPTEAEARLVKQLRGAGDAAIELVAEDSGRIVGHILFSPMEAPFRALALAPVAVTPDRQADGIGSALIETGHDHARAAGWDAIFVLGEPGYYSRFGYSAVAAAGFESPYAGPYFMMLGLRAGLPATGAVRHAPAFAAL